MSGEPAPTKDHYWICDECAKKKGWEPVPYGVTCIRSKCPTCGEEKLLACAHTDFIKNGKEPLVWD